MDLSQKMWIQNQQSEPESIILDVDYDDAFVAYINGVEIGRKKRDIYYPLVDPSLFFFF